MAAKKKAAKKAKAAPKKKAAPAKKAAKRGAPKRAAARAAAPKVAAVVHWEIQARDAAAEQRFYRELFGWTIDANNPMNYGLVASRGKEGINGGIGSSAEGGSRVVVYVSVPDINATLAKAEQLGAKTLMPRTDIGMVVMALYADPEGNVMGLVEGG